MRDYANKTILNNSLKFITKKKKGIENIKGKIIANTYDKIFGFLR